MLPPIDWHMCARKASTTPDSSRLQTFQHLGDCLPMLFVRFRQNPQKPRTRIYMDLSYIDPQTRVLNLMITVSSNKSNHQTKRVSLHTDSSPGCEGGQSVRRCFFPLPVSDLSWVDAAPALLDILWAPREWWATSSRGLTILQQQHLLQNLSTRQLNVSQVNFVTNRTPTSGLWRKHVVQALKNDEEADWFGWNHAPQPAI